METIITMDYNCYLFCCLLKEYDSDFSEMEHDLQYEKVFEEYKKFQESGYDDPSENLYDCITEYLQNFRVFTNKQTATDGTK